MKFNILISGLWFLLMTSHLESPRVLWAASSSDLAQAKKEAEAKGLIFELSRDEIVAKAKREGKMRALSSMETQTIKAMAEAFKAEYPFLDVQVVETTGTEAIQRFILEMKAGGAKGWDATHISTDFYNEFPPYLKKFDILGMAKHGVVRIPTQIIDPVNRTIIAVTSGIQVVAYNRKLLSAESVPVTWEDFLKPEHKGRKFVADIRPTEIAALAPAWGLERTLDFARRIASQEPIWVRGATRTLTAMAAGEYSLFIGPGFHTVMRAQAKDPTKSLDLRIVEPVPTRLTEAVGVLNTAEHPYAALLWLEFQASPKGQKIADEHEPYGASVFVPDSTLEKRTRGKKLSLVNWDHFTRMRDYQGKVVEAYGFPKAVKGK